MPWAKIDDQFHSNPKVAMAGPNAISLYIVALSWTAGYLTDGFIPSAQVRRLALCDDYDAAARRLVEVGLWHEADGGYQINDYLEYNPSAKEIKAKRKAAAKRQAEYRERQQGDDEDDDNKDEGNAVSNGVTNDDTNTTSRSRPRTRSHAHTYESSNEDGKPPPSPKIPHIQSLTIAEIKRKNLTANEWRELLALEETDDNPRITLIDYVKQKLVSLEPMSDTEEKFLDLWGAKQLKTPAQRRTLAGWIDDYGPETVLEAGEWAAKRGMSLSDCFISLETALPKWNGGDKSKGTLRVGR